MKLKLSIRMFKCLLFIFLFIFIMNVFTLIGNTAAAFTLTSSQCCPKDLNDLWEYRFGDPGKGVDEIDSWINSNQNGDWKSYSLTKRPVNKNSNNSMWLRTKLPFIRYNNPCLFIKTVDQSLEVYLGSNLIYSYGNMYKPNPIKESGPKWHIIPLNFKYEGQTLALHLYSNQAIKVGLLYSVRIRNISDNIMSIVKGDIVYIILLSMLLLASIFAIILYLLGRTKQAWLLNLEFFMLCLSIWMLSQSDILHLAFNNSTILSCLHVLACYLRPVGLINYVNNVFQKGKSRLLKLLGWAHVACAAAILLIKMIPVPNAYYVLLPVYLTIHIGAIIVMIVLTKYRASSNDLNARMLVIGLNLFLLINTYDMISKYFGVLPLYNNNLPILTLFSFIGILIFISARYFGHLHYMVREYSYEIENKKYELNEVIKTDKKRTDFFLNMSHELRTPLSIILGTLQLLKLYLDKEHKWDGNKVQFHINTMQQNCYRLLKLVNDLIDITKIDSGYAELNMKKIDIVALVEDVTMSAVDYSDSKGISLCFDTDVEEKAVICDPDKIERVILNLLSNAIKFTESGKNVTVKIHDEKDNVYISVKDEGIGMPQDKLNSIFERFVQIDNPLARGHVGSGIGLSIVKSIVEMHKGTISVKSEYGKGSEFIIKLPALNSYEASFDDPNMIYNSHEEKLKIEFSDMA